MFFLTVKYPICLFSLGAFLVFSTTVSAQSHIIKQEPGTSEQPKIVLTDPERVFEIIQIGDSQKTVRTNYFHGKLEPKNTSAFQAIDSESEQTGELKKTQTTHFTYRLFPPNKREKYFESDYLPFRDENKKSTFQPLRAQTDSTDDAKDSPPPGEGFRWRSAIQQSLVFLAVQHGYAFTQPKTREALKGKFFKEYAESVKSLRGWNDGGRFFTNYLAHPMQGAFTGFIYVQNDPKAARQKFGLSGDYWRSRLKAMAWTAAWSTQFEIGPISQASIGNVGLNGKQTWIDIVITPTVGTTMLVTEDALDRFVMQRIERKTDNFYVKIFSRMLLSPTRVFANLLRLKAPWYRDRPTAH